MDFQFLFPFVFYLRCEIIKLIIKSHYTFNPLSDVFADIRNTFCFLLRLKAHVSLRIVPENNSISVGGSLLSEFLFSRTVRSLGSFGKQIIVK